MDQTNPPPGSEPPDGSEPPHAGEGRPRGTVPVDPDSPCMNCGSPAPGEYCSSCGQRKVNVRVSVWALIMDVLEDQFILDKRLPRTLGNLFFRPGRLTVEHINGRIVRYIHPFRLYLVSSLVFFLVLSFLSLQLVRRAMDQGSGVRQAVETGQAAALDETIAELEGILADTTSSADDRTQAQTQLEIVLAQRRGLQADSLAAVMAGLDSALATLDQALTDTTVPAPVLQALEANREQMQRQRDTALARREALSGAEGNSLRDSATTDPEPRTLAEHFNWDENPPTLSLGSPAADSAAMNQIRRLGDMTPRQAAETITATFFDYVPIMMFVLLPVFAGVLKFLYIRRERYYAEHFVFLLHVHSFVFLLATVILLLRNHAAGWVESGLGLWLVVYIYIAMLRVYGQGWFKTFAKFWTLGWMYFWILLVSMVIVFLAALLLF